MREEINENFLKCSIEILTNETHIDYKRIKRRKSDDEPKSGDTVWIYQSSVHTCTHHTHLYRANWIAE